MFFAYCLMTIAKKTNTENGWLAFIPIANIYLMCKIAGKPGWWVILFLIPVVNIVMSILVFMGMCEARGKEGWIGILVIIPLVGAILLIWLAFSNGGQPSAATA